MPETATPGAAATPSGETPSPASEKPTKLQSPPSAETKPNAKMTPAEMRQLSDEYFKQCMQDWDAATHMTKQDWQRTCRRVADNRAHFLIEGMGK